MQQVLIKSGNEFKLIETEIDSTRAYMKIASKMVKQNHSAGWFTFWELVNESESFTFSMPYNVRMEEWEEAKIRSLGYEIKWNDKVGCYDVVVYPQAVSKGE